MTKDEVLDLALEALEGMDILFSPLSRDCTQHNAVDRARKAITAIKQAKSAPVQEPVGKVIASVPHLRSISVELLPEAPVPSEDSLLYTTPPAAQRQWVGLTPHERMMCRSYDIDEAIANTEAKLKEKNT